MTLTFHSNLSKDFSLILNDADDFNVIIQVGENQNTKEFRAHSVILRARSPYFKSALSADWVTKKNNMITFNKPNITPAVFEMILKYIYTGELDLTEQLGEDILGLLVSSDELLIEELFKNVQDYLIEKQSTWVQQNFVSVLNFAFKLSSCKKLQDYCLESVCKDPQQFIISETFPSLDQNALLGLFKRNDFQIEEVVAWDSLIKWGVKQTPELKDKDNPDEWTDKNYEDLKNTLSDFIPLIKFLKITSKDFHHKVRPYRDIIPSNIYEEAMTYYLVEQPKLYEERERKREEEKESEERERQYSHIIMPNNIIKPNIANIIANWIDRKDSAVFSPNNKYRFNQIYLMSLDGFNNVAFYNKCKGKGPFVVIIRVQSKKIYGGYNPIGYADRNGWQSSTESFIFSFENNQDMRNMKIDRVINANYSVYEQANCFFSFGRHLYVNGQNLYVGNSGYYNNSLGNGGSYLPVEEIEVFSIVKK